MKHLPSTNQLRVCNSKFATKFTKGVLTVTVSMFATGPVLFAYCKSQGYNTPRYKVMANLCQTRISVSSVSSVVIGVLSYLVVTLRPHSCDPATAQLSYLTLLT